MRLVRLVVAGVVLGAVGGYVAALLRPRTVHRNPAAEPIAPGAAPLPERAASIDLEAPAEVRG